MQKQNPGMVMIAGLMGIGVTLSLLAACTGAKPPAQGSDALVVGERGSLEGTLLPPMQVKFEEMGDFPPVGSARIPLNTELEQHPPMPPIQFKPEEMGDFPPIGSPSLPAKLELKQE